MLLFMLIFIVLLGVVQHYYRKKALVGIDYNYSVSKKVVEPQELFEYTCTLKNNSNRFIPFVRTIQVMPDVKHEDDTILRRLDDFKTPTCIYDSSTYLPRKSIYQLTIDLSIAKRGVHDFRGVSLYIGDFLGATTIYKRFEKVNQIVVYPPFLKSPLLNKKLGSFLGDISIRRFIMEDPVLIVGMREYTGREPMKHISWKQTAKTQHLVVKQFDYTTEMLVQIILDVADNLTEDEYETLYSVTRSMVQDIHHRKISYNLVTNAIIHGYFKEKSTFDAINSTSMSHLQHTLELLGRGGYGCVKNLDSLLHNMPLSNSSVVILILGRHDARKIKLVQEKLTQNSNELLVIVSEDYMTKTSHAS